MGEQNIHDTIAAGIKNMRRQVEIAANLKVRTAGDFELLSQMVFNRTGVLLSATTLKRIWGYLQEGVVPRRATLDVMAQFCGWRSYADFQAGNIPEIESGNVGRPFIRADENIRVGERVKLFWHPSRICEIEYTGSKAWIVVASEGTRLQPGDTFSCALIVSGEPLYLDNLYQAGMYPGIYVCGRKTGVRFEYLGNK